MRRLFAAAAVLVLCGGCQAAIRVGVDADDHGGGRVVAVVTLDKDAQQIVGDLKGRLHTADLKKAGWTIVGPAKVGTDLRISASKKFTTPAGAARAVHELDGGSGLFNGFTVAQQRSFFRTSTQFHGTVDLRKGVDAFSDPTLQQELGSPLGATPNEFSKRIGTQLESALPITVGVILPGTVSSNAPVEGGGSAAWHPKLGDRIELSAAAKQWNVLPVGLAALAVLAAGTALILGFGGRRGRGHRRGPSPSPR